MNIEIHDLADDDWITEPGFYRLSIDRHHNQPCMSPDEREAFEKDGTMPPSAAVSVTSGVLRRMEEHGPSKVWAAHYLNPNRYPEKDTEAKILGRAMAAIVEGGSEMLEKHFRVLPDYRPSRPTKQQLRALAEGRATEKAKTSIAFWSDVDKDPRDKITESQYETLVTMGGALAADPAAAHFFGGEPELTMAWQDERTGIWCLSRPDNVRRDSAVTDYKKVNMQGGPFIAARCDALIERHGYDMQMAFAAEGWERHVGTPPSDVGLAFQEDEPPYEVILREIDAEALAIGRFYNRRSLVRFAECYTSGRWPGPGDDIGIYQMSDARREAALQEMQTAGTAP